MITGVIFIIGILVIGFLFLVHNAMTKPIYNKMHNMWHDDPEGRKIANITLVVMLFIAFYLGTLF
jgi:D-alanyl-lipoteichoic acid acyltransferase DltB (MBOAT superfamily)